MTYILSSKNSTKFICEICDYKCCKQSEYNQHCLTANHLNTDIILTHTDPSHNKNASSLNVLNVFPKK